MTRRHIGVGGRGHAQAVTMHGVCPEAARSLSASESEVQAPGLPAVEGPPALRAQA